MKKFFFLTIFLCSSMSWANTKSQQTISNPLKKGDCFSYNEFEGDEKYKWVVGRVENLHLYNFEYQGTLYAKLDDDKPNTFVTYKFDMPFKKQTKFKRTTCPKDLPKE